MKMFGFRKKHEEPIVKEEQVVEEPKTEEKGEEVESVEKDEPVTGRYSVEAVGRIIEFVLGDRYDGFQLKDETQRFKKDFFSNIFDFMVYMLSGKGLTLRIAVESYYEKPCTKLKFDVVDVFNSNLIADSNPFYSVDLRKILRYFFGEEAELKVRSLETLPDDLIAVMDDGPYKDEGKAGEEYEKHGNIMRLIRWKGRGLLNEPLDVKDADRVIEDLKNKGWRE